MNEQEEQAVENFVTTVLALVTQEAIQEKTIAFIDSRDTSEEMLRMAYAECKSFASQRLEARCENVLFLSRRKHLGTACTLLSQKIDSYASSQLQFSFGIDVEQDQLRFD